MVKAKVEAAKKQLLSELDSEREHHQKLVKEHARLQQRLENLHGEMEYLTSPQGHKRTPSDISAISLESYTSSVSPDEKKEEENEKEVNLGEITSDTCYCLSYKFLLVYFQNSCAVDNYKN